MTHTPHSTNKHVKKTIQHQKRRITRHNRQQWHGATINLQLQRVTTKKSIMMYGHIIIATVQCGQSSDTLGVIYEIKKIRWGHLKSYPPWSDVFGKFVDKIFLHLLMQRIAWPFRTQGSRLAHADFGAPTQKAYKHYQNEAFAKERDESVLSKWYSGSQYNGRHTRR